MRVNNSKLPNPESTLIPQNFHESIERQIEEAYKLGLLHGINAQSMAQVKNEVMEFEDYGWDCE